MGGKASIMLMRSVHVGVVNIIPQYADGEWWPDELVANVAYT